MSYRVWGRVTDELGNKTWVQVVTDENGYSDGVYVTWLIQVLKLQLNESPFWANYGIPVQQTMMTQIFPDYYVAQTQSQFSQYFANLQVAKISSPTPTYNINILTRQGATIQTQVPV